MRKKWRKGVKRRLKVIERVIATGRVIVIERNTESDNDRERDREKDRQRVRV